MNKTCCIDVFPLLRANWLHNQMMQELAHLRKPRSKILVRATPSEDFLWPFGGARCVVSVAVVDVAA